MARLSLTLLGGFQARLEPGGAVSLPTRKAQALLAYLALPLGQAHPRSKLAALLWGGIREESARKSLRQALFEIRKALATTEPSSLVVTGDTIALDRRPVAVDAAQFEGLLGDPTPDALERASALYQGDLLAGLAIDEAPFEEWLLGERERLRELALEGLARLLAQQRKGGTAEAAVQTALRLLALDPLQEAVHRTLMRLYAELGRRGTALRQYQQCVSILGRQLGVEPEPESKALYQEILRQRSSRGAVVEPAMAGPGLPGTVVASRAPVAELPLVGRATELEHLRTALERASGGHGSAVAVLGEAGIGKTRLVGELIAAAEGQSVRILLGRCYESEQVLAFGPWVDAFRAGHAIEDLRTMAAPWRAVLAHLLPELGGPDVEPLKTPPDSLKVFESVTAAIGVLAERRRLLLVLEDLHWADEMSLRLLAFLGRRLRPMPVLAAVTVREEELADATMLRRVLDELARERHLQPLPLAGLSRDDTLTLVHTLARAGTDATALARLGEVAWDASAGNPFVVVETLRAPRQGLGLAEPVRQLVTRRLERLSERGRVVTTVAAVIGREFEFALLRRAAGLGDADAAEAMEELVRRRVLQGVGERFDFTHDRIREVARADLLAPRRQVLHRSVAEAIEAVYADDLEPHILALGLHYHGAEMWLRAMGYLRRAAEHGFARSAYREAATCLERALEATSRLPRTPELLDQVLDLQLRLRTALWPLAEFDRIAACLEAAEQVATSLDDRGRLGRIAAFMSVLHWISGDVRAARRFGQRAREAAAALEDRPLRLMSNYYVGLAHYLLAEYREAEEAYLENVQTLSVAEEAADPLGPPGSTLVRTAAWLVLPLADRGVFARGLAHGRQALDLAEAAQDLYGIVSAAYCLAYLHCLKGDVAMAVPLLERALAICREREFGVWLPQVSGYLGHAYAQVGRLDEASALLEEAIDVYEATRAWPFRPLLTVHRGTACLHAGRVDAALALGQEALTLARDHGERGHEAWALHLLGEIASERGAAEAPPAQRYYREALGLADELGMRPLLAHCHAGLARLCGRMGQPAEAQHHLRTAASLYHDMDMPFWLARVQREAGGPKSR